MHGHKRAEYKAAQRDPTVSAALAAKAEKWYALTADLQQRRQQERTAGNVVDPTTMSPRVQDGDTMNGLDAGLKDNHLQVADKLTAKLLTVNPDPLNLWNHRREILLSRVDGQFELTTELNLTQAALENNPKSYGAWFHRKWSISHHMKLLAESPTAPMQIILETELALTELFLKRDERNFHCWNYRRYVLSCLFTNSDPSIEDPDGSWKFLSEQEDQSSPQVIVVMGSQVSPPPPKSTIATSCANAKIGTITNHHERIKSEWEFTTAKIQDNFSNFSAFHYRSKLLPLFLWIKTKGEEKNEELRQQVLEVELSLVENAIFTEPDDQTAWWYHRFLLDYFFVQNESVCKDQIQVLQNHCDQLRELVEEVGTESKWVWLGLLLVLQKIDGGGGVGSSGYEHERRGILTKLLELDPDRKVRYQHMQAKLKCSN